MGWQHMPDYIGLTRMLLEPLLEEGSSLAVDCETTCGGKRILLRASFSQEDKGRVFGRGGRTIHAVRQVLSAAGELAHQRVQLDVGDRDRPSSPRGRRR
ncbi:KH domain-containing protein [Synechococcus sp. PCC 7336]|uniref:KH domain-containing protein n=1 Tax=Synechococcus sp. PCC 7336 TaxID=195250 RepID=UPI00034AEB59|nr:KH domain-containing protein [Synechococcus sp. PCC 7336]